MFLLTSRAGPFVCHEVFYELYKLLHAWAVLYTRGTPLRQERLFGFKDFFRCLAACLVNTWLEEVAVVELVLGATDSWTLQELFLSI